MKERISELENKIKELEEQKKLYEEIIDKLPLGVQIFDENGYSYFMNPAQGEHLGVSDLSMGIGKFNVLTDPYSVANGASKIYEDVYNGNMFKHEFNYDLGIKENKWDTRKDKRILQESIFPVKDKNGNTKFVIALLNDVTEQRNTEYDLNQSVKKFEDFVNHSPDIMYKFSNKNGTLYWSNRVKEILGYTPDELIMSPFIWTNSIHPEDKKRTLDAIFNFGSDKGYSIEYRIKTKSGNWIWLHDTLMFKTEIGDEVIIEGYASDVTAKKIAEQKLKESEQRWYFSVDGSGLGLWDWEVTTGKVFFSTQWKKMLGYEESEVEDKLEEWDKRVHPEDKEQTYKDINLHLDGKTEMYQNEHRVLCKDGSYKWILDRGKVVEWTKDGKPHRVIGTHTDITEKKLHEIEQARLYARYRLLFEQSPIGIYIADKYGRIIDGNKRLLELLDSPSLEATKEINLLTFHPLVQNGYAEAFKKCIAARQKQTLELEYESKWGKNTYLSAYILPLFNEANELESVYTLMEDISERKKAEQELKESEARLELFFEQSLIGYFFMMLDEPIEWNDSVDKEKALDYVFEHQRVVKINDAMLAQYNATPEQFLGFTPADFFAHNIDDGRKVWRNFFDKGKWHVDTNERTLDGKPIIINGDYICMYDSEGRITGHFGVQRDVTAERNAEEKLRNSETNFRSFFNTIDSYLFILNENGNVIEFNKAVEDKLGYNSQDLIGKSVIEVHPPDRREEAGKIVLGMLDGKRDYCPIPLLTKKGELIPVETYVKNGMWNGKPAIFGVSKDISMLKLSEEKFSKAFQMSSAIAGLSTVGTGEYIEVNKMFCNLLGYSEAEVIGKKASSLNILSKENNRKLKQKLLQNKKIRNEDVVLQTKTGKKIDALLSAEIIEINDMQYNFTMAVDVSEIKEKEKELIAANRKAEDSNRRLKEAQKIAMFGDWMYNLRTKKLEWSDEIYNILEINKEQNEPQKKLFYETLDSYDKKRMLHEFITSQKSKQPFDFVHRIFLGNNKVKHIRQRGRTEFDEKGVPLNVRGTAQDVTKEKQLQSRLVKSEILKKNILTNVPTLIWAKDVDGVYIACNPEFERFFCAKELEIIGKTDYDFVDQELADFFRMHDKIAMENGQPTVNEEWITYKDNGERALLETTKTPLRDENGEIFGVLGISYNITARKEKEEALQNAKKDAEKANLLKSEFLANMSHEIRTPMNAVLGYSEILAKKLSHRPEYLNYVEGITKSGKNLISLINDILDLSKIEAGQMEIIPEPINLSELIDDIKQIFAVKIAEKNIEFITTIDKRLPETLLLDQKRIRQILFNIVGNALKFTEKGKIGLKLSISGNVEPNSEIDVLLEVMDTGIGIPEKQLKNIFEAFHQSKNYTGSIEGTGLGLSITKRLVEAMSGTISVESELGKGSTFYINLKSIKIPSLEKKSEEPKRQGEVDFLGAKVLVVDDIISNIEILKDNLFDVNCEVKEAQNGAEALALLEEYIPDLIIMDIQMPVMNGYDATKKIKENERLKNIPVIAITALALKEQQDEYAHVFNDYLKKPVEFGYLVLCMKKYLNFRADIETKSKVDIQKDETLSQVINSCNEQCLNEIYNEIFPLFDELMVLFDTDDSFRLAEKVFFLSEKYDVPKLKSWSQKLRLATQEVQFNQIQVLLKNFEIFKQELIQKVE